MSAILVNAVAGSNDNVAIGVPATVAVTDGTTWQWAFLDQPLGTPDVLANPTSQTATFTPKKEGSYLVRCLIDAGTQSVQAVTAIVAVRELKSTIRLPAAGETCEVDPTRGWAGALNTALQQLDRLVTDPGTVIAAGTATVQALVRFSGVTTIKAGMAAPEEVATVAPAQAGTLANLPQTLGVVEAVIPAPVGSTMPALVNPGRRFLRPRSRPGRCRRRTASCESRLELPVDLWRTPPVVKRPARFRCRERPPGPRALRGRRRQLPWLNRKEGGGRRCNLPALTPRTLPYTAVAPTSQSNPTKFEYEVDSFSQPMGRR